MKYIEVEQKFHVDNHQSLREQLKAKGAKKLGTEHQIDVYYNAPHRDFLAEPRVNEWLRLRQEDEAASINYKRWLPLDAEVKTHCDELESPVGDLEAMRKLLAALDFIELITVDKHREEWQFGDIIVALDSVKGLGDFIEFEYKGAAETVAEAQKSIEKCITNLGVSLGERDYLGYPYILLAERSKLQQKHN